MKKLLALLLLSPLAFAEPINISCKYYSTLDMNTFKVEPTSGINAFTIKPSTKEIIDEDGSFTYTETGNQISWKAYGAVEIGDKYAMAWEYRLNRVSSELEVDFMSVENDKGFETKDLLGLIDFKNYKLQLTHTAKCERVEALF